MVVVVPRSVAPILVRVYPLSVTPILHSFVQSTASILHPSLSWTIAPVLGMITVLAQAIRVTGYTFPLES